MLPYLTLFAISFAAATIFPMQSELVFAGMIASDHFNWLLLLLIASLGNILGSIVNWMLGRYFSRFQDRKWFPVKPDKLEFYKTRYQRYGRWSLLLSWVPIIGDPLTVLAGVLREPLPIFILIVSIAKIGRYLVVAGITMQWF